MTTDITKRLLNPPFGTETSERLLMAEAAEVIRQLVDLAHQYANDLRYPVAPDSKERRLELIARTIAKAGA